MGHPLEAVAWLANLLNQQGKMLEREMIVMTGSSITTKFPHAGDCLSFLIEGMGDVRLELTH
jgi:2-keto-4-pentenoate hydratase